MANIGNFTKTTWLERIRQYAGRFTLTPTGTTNQYDLTRVEGTVTQQGTPISITNLQHIEDAVDGLYNGSYTPNDTQTLASNGTFKELFGMLARLIKSITGKPEWYFMPSTSIEALNTDKVSKSGDTMTYLTISKNADAVLALEDTSAPASSYRLKRIFSSNNVNGGNSWLFRATRRDTNTNVDTYMDASGGILLTTNNSGISNREAFQGAITTGYTTLTDTLTAGQVITKSIPLGGTFRYGIVVVQRSFYGIIVHIDTNNLNTFITGFSTLASDWVGSAWTRRVQGKVTDNTLGDGVIGDFNLVINEMYISGTNLIMQIYNTSDTNNRSLNCNVDWRVWY